eukprot:scaffold2082_cov111-Isochrysis_galbana.AAC.5
MNATEQRWGAQRRGAQAGHAVAHSSGERRRKDGRPHHGHGELHARDEDGQHPAKNQHPQRRAQACAQVGEVLLGAEGVDGEADGGGAGQHQSLEDGHRVSGRGVGAAGGGHAPCHRQREAAQQIQVGRVRVGVDLEGRGGGGTGRGDRQVGACCVWELHSKGGLERRGCLERKREWQLPPCSGAVIRWAADQRSESPGVCFPCVWRAAHPLAGYGWPMHTGEHPQWLVR